MAPVSERSSPASLCISRRPKHARPRSVEPASFKLPVFAARTFLSPRISRTLRSIASQVRCKAPPGAIFTITYSAEGNGMLEWMGLKGSGSKEHGSVRPPPRDRDGANRNEDSVRAACGNPPDTHRTGAS